MSKGGEVKIKTNSVGGRVEDRETVYRYET